MRDRQRVIQKTEKEANLGRMSASLRILLVGAVCVCVRVIPRMQILKLKPNLVDADHKRQR